ncbi:MAG: aminopeptidase P family protein, partial [Clostridiales bacterium]|nr:aminopeptidase P family protein [Clostridiales bacterium]
MIKNRINNLRRLMKEYHIDFYIIPSTDYHNSEYVTSFFCAREFLSGFTGSNGTLLVSENSACLWTDGRYFIQAQKELESSDIALFKMQEPMVPTLLEYLAENIKAGQVIGFDGRVINASFFNDMKESVKKEGIMYNGAYDLVNEIWTDRPKLPCNQIFVLPDEIAGEPFFEKIARLRVKMSKRGAQACLISKLDDIMWLYNIRGNDIPFNPVALSYTFITMNQAYLLIQKQALTKQASEYFEMQGITVLPYESILQFLKDLKIDGKVLLDTKNSSYALYSQLDAKATILDQRNITEELKAVKNKIEIEQLRKIYLKDSVAVTKYIYWLTQVADLSVLNEFQAGKKMDLLRREIEE